MKNKGLIITLIVIFVIISICLICFMVSVINGNFKFKNMKMWHHVSTNLVIDDVYKQEFEEIKIDSKAADIVIKHGDDNNVRVVIYDDYDKSKTSVSGNKLNIISDRKECNFFCINLKVAKIEVYVPEEYEKNLVIVNNYGNVEIDNFSLAKIDITEDCGDVSVVSGDIVNIKNSFGDIRIDNVNSADVEEDCGDVTIGTVKKINATNQLGDIKIDKILEEMDLANDCGNIIIKDLNLIKNSYIKDDLGDIKISNTNEIYIDAKTDLGDIKINNNYNKSDIVLKIENDCGDIKVEN